MTLRYRTPFPSTDTFSVYALNDGVEIGGGHEGGAMVATVDERGHFLRDTLSPVEVRALLSPAGGEPLADDILD